MNKNIKRIVAIALAIGTFSAISPATNVNLLTTKAYAATNDTDTLSSLSLETTSGSTIKLYSDTDYASSNKVDSSDVTDGDTYYAKTSSSTINISKGGPSSTYVKVFKGTSSSTKGKSISSDISLSSGTNTLTVRVYSEAPGSSMRYDDDSYVSQYIIKVKYTGSDSSTSSGLTADDYGNIYLDRLSVDGTSISLSDSKINYTYNVASDVTETTIKAMPADTDNDTITIDGSTVDDSDSYKKTVSLNTGDNKFQIETNNSDDDTDRVYTLTITRGTTSSTTTGTGTTTATTTPSTATNVVTTTAKASQWVQANGAWQYNDAVGNAIKNSWFTDRNYGKDYYLQADGNMATGWLSNNGSWYYLGTDGAKKTGWQSANGTWYYLDSQGIMQTGWMKDITGKYYYLNSNGTMASNTTIGGYKLGTDGAWTK